MSLFLCLSLSVSHSLSSTSVLILIFSFLFSLPQRLDVLTGIYSLLPPEGSAWDCTSCVHMPDGLTVQVPVRRDQTVADLLSAACKVGFVATTTLH